MAWTCRTQRCAGFSVRTLLWSFGRGPARRAPTPCSTRTPRGDLTYATLAGWAEAAIAQDTAAARALRSRWAIGELWLSDRSHFAYRVRRGRGTARIHAVGHRLDVSRHGGRGRARGAWKRRAAAHSHTRLGGRLRSDRHRQRAARPVLQAPDPAAPRARRGRRCDLRPHLRSQLCILRHPSTVIGHGRRRA
jgi:hypothetical protein